MRLDNRQVWIERLNNGAKYFSYNGKELDETRNEKDKIITLWYEDIQTYRIF
jgi:hypothetical protein